MTLHRIHEGLFDAVEEEDAEERDRQGDAPAEGDVRPGDHAGSEEHVPEGFDDDGHGIAEVEGSPLCWNHVDGVHHRRGIHPEMDSEAHQVVEVAVLGGQR